MIMVGKTVEQVHAEFKMPAEFAHCQGATRLKDFLKLFYHQGDRAGILAVRRAAEGTGDTWPRNLPVVFA